MASDISRKLFDPLKHYSGVLMQQGRVQMDADWNEQLDIHQYRTHTESVDVIGESGVPQNVQDGNSFKISFNENLFIGPGRMYVHGLLCELEEECTYATQPYYPAPGNKAAENTHFSAMMANHNPEENNGLTGDFLVYIDAWQREVNYLDDSLIQETALGGPDTTTRLQTVWQVKFMPLKDRVTLCDASFPEWEALIKPSTGTLNVQTVASAGDNPCLIPPRSAYRRLENQLYRIEVHQGGSDPSTISFKWSRDNASIETRIESYLGNVLNVSDIGRDETLGFANGQWVEIIDDISSLHHIPRPLYKIKHVDPKLLTIELENDIVLQPGQGVPKKLRRWDQSNAGADENGVTSGTGWLKIEDGIEIQFGEGTYRTGDYWVFPGRTPKAEVEWPPYQIPNAPPIAQPPRGIHHFFCKLALITIEQGKIDIQDWRPMFAPLTELASNDDLYMNNKYLHGMGVVCGLKIKCGQSRTQVTIEKGVALDCEGHMIRVKTPINYAIVAAAARKKLLDAGGNGRFCLTILRGCDHQPVISLEPFVPQHFWDRVLEGTLLKDFWDECIQSLITLFIHYFPIPFNGGETVPVDRNQRRLTAFINLIAQLINHSSGPYGFISGNSGKKEILGDGSDEDDLLREFYYALKEKLASETFCAMYDGDRLFPEYQIEPGLDTIFGPPYKMHNKLYLHPEGRFAYTCGHNNKVYVYSLLDSQELIEISTFPVAGTNIQIQDIAISIRGDLLSAVGLENTNSWFAEAKIDQATGKLTWGNPSVVNNVKYVSLGIDNRNILFAVAKSWGVHEISGIGGIINVDPVTNSFNATGLLHIASIQGEGECAIVAAIHTVAPGAESASFDHFRIIPLSNPNINLEIVAGGLDAAHDILVYRQFIFATSDNAGQRTLGKYKIDGQPVVNLIPIDDKSYIRMAVCQEESQEGRQEFLLLTLSDKYKAIRIPLNDNGGLEIDNNFRIPTQILPIDIVVDKRNSAAYVLNSLVNTLTTIDFNRVFQTQPRPQYTFEPPYDIAEYRYGVYYAYYDLLSHVVQSLKDCFCDKFLIDCTECDDLEENVYLGCVDIRNEQVHHICNFSKRKYVKSFRTVDYWLSTVPVIPIVREAFSQFCCMVIERPDKRAETNFK